MEISTVLFDLDGTITDSGSGIINSVKYALKRLEGKFHRRMNYANLLDPPFAGTVYEMLWDRRERGSRDGGIIQGILSGRRNFLITGSMMESWKC